MLGGRVPRSSVSGAAKEYLPYLRVNCMSPGCPTGHNGCSFGRRVFQQALSVHEGRNANTPQIRWCASQTSETYFFNMFIIYYRTAVLIGEEAKKDEPYHPEQRLGREVTGS
ncbi:uncharacterized protein LOC123321999 [Coccinella septempunctata]|uniref:uncharacterized protein LOC123321999 n=1 Tax=Coccinella septempunctata TaxID=41139 RepID=UPI001D05E5FB|nr:uncharacterized protein LOC123321999 [Coccinella septempunctata]